MRALPALQLFTSLLSAMGLLTVYHALKLSLKDPYSSLLLTLCGSVMAAFWVWSVEAQVYMLGFLGIAWATYFLLKPYTRWKWIWIGIAHAAAVLGHVLYGLWLIPAFFWLWTESKREMYSLWKSFLQYIIVFLAIVISAYGIVLTQIIYPEHPSWAWVKKWLLGSAALTLDGHFAWHWGGWNAPIIGLFTTLRLIWGNWWPYGSQTHPLLLQGLFLISAALIGYLFVCSWKERRNPLWLFSGLWLLAYSLFLWTWEPSTECYRISDIIPILFLLSLGLTYQKRRFVRYGILTSLFVSLFGLNLLSRIYPMQNPRNNVPYMNTLQLINATPSTSLYLTGGGLQMIYLLYFTGRAAWDIHRHSLSVAQHIREIELHKHFYSIYIIRDILQEPDVREWINNFKLVPIRGVPDWVQLQ